MFISFVQTKAGRGQMVRGENVGELLRLGLVPWSGPVYESPRNPTELETDVDHPNPGGLRNTEQK